MKTFTTYAEKKAKQFFNLLQGYTKGIRTTAILILLLMGVSNAWADYTWYSGDLLYYDFSAVSGGVNWHDGSTMQYDGSGGGKVKKVEFSNQVTMKNDWVVAKTNKGGWSEIKFSNPPSANQRRFIINSDGKTASWGYLDKYIAGDNWGGIGSWSTTTKKMTNNNNGTYTINFTSITASAHEFKIVNYDTWTGAIGHSNNVSCINGTLENNGGNIKFTPYIAGNVTITYDVSNGKAVITCPAPTITFDMEGGSGGTQTQEAPYGTATSAITVPTKTGYTFGGYYNGDNGTGTQIIGTDGKWIKSKTNFTNADNKWIVTSNTTLYAKWTANVINYTVDYGVCATTRWGSIQLNSGSAVTTSSSSTLAQGTALTFTAKPNTGYQVEGWYSDANCSQKITEAGTSTPYDAGTLTANKTVYVKFEGITYTITMDKQEGTDGTDEVTVQYNNNNYSVNPIEIPTLSGYDFGGYYVARNGGGFQVINESGQWVKNANGYTDASGNWTRTNNVTLYAKWTEQAQPDPTHEIYLVGLFNHWTNDDANYEFEETSPGIYTLTKDFTKRERYHATDASQAEWEFKLRVDGTNYTVGDDGNGRILQYTRQNTTKIVDDGSDNSYNLLLQADQDGEYIFTYEVATKRLTVTHPKYDPEASYIVGDFSDETPGTDATPKDGGAGKDWTETYGQELEDGVGCIELGKNSTWNFKIKINGIWYGASDVHITGSGTYTLNNQYADTGIDNCTIETNGSDECYRFSYVDNGDGTITLTVGYPEEDEVEDANTVYLKLNNEWKKDNARFAVYYWNDGGNTWKDMEDIDCNGDYYKAEVPEGYSKLIFVQMKPETTENKWANKKDYQTPDLTLPTDGKNLCDVEKAKYLYLTPNSNWKEAGARFAAYFYGNGEKWVDMKDDDGDGIYTCEKQSGFPHVIFCRMNPGTTENKWDNRWNQTGNLSILNDGKDHFTLNDDSWDNGTWAHYSWTTYNAPTYDVTINITGKGSIVIDGTTYTSNSTGTTTEKKTGVEVNTNINVTAITAAERWAKSAATIKIGNNDQEELSTSHSICGPTTINVTFEQTQCVVHFELQLPTGTVHPAIDNQIVDVNTTADKPQVDNIDGYIFGGWYTDAACSIGKEYDFTKPVTQDIILYAKWIPYGDCVFFKNNLNWDEVYVYFYSSDKYWTDDKGTGANMNSDFPINSGHRPHYRKFRGKMTRIGLTDIWYFDYISAAKQIDPTNWEQIKDHTDNAENDINYSNIAFTAHEQYDHSFFDNTKVIRRGDFKPDMQLFIPQTDQTPTYLNEHDGKSTRYYNKGLWMIYNSTESGYNWSSDVGGWDNSKNYFTSEIAGGYSFTAEVELNAGSTYDFKIHNQNGTWFGNTGTMTQDNCTNWWFKEEVNDNAQIQPTVTGTYIFTAYLGDGKVMISLDYPLSTGDYRLAYLDIQAGSFHPGHYIKKRTKVEEKRDTVSFFVVHDKTPEIQLQECTNITSEGIATWETIATYSNINSIATATTVYNFILKQTNINGTHARSVETSETHLYTGDYYIRTDAAAGGWKSFRQEGNKMTYNSYADEHEDFDHYFCEWVSQDKGLKNVSYTVANDYSYCISDTLLKDVDEVHPKIVTDADGKLPTDANGKLKDANVRWGWDSKTNKIRRAYIAGSGHKKDRFLVLEGNASLQDVNGNRFTGQTAEGQDRYKLTDDEVVFEDMGNWIYQIDVKANKDTKIDLTALYDGKVQYFKGGSEDGDERLLIVTTNDNEKYYKIRIIYDFKTNHLISAWLPEDETITTDEQLGADMMIIRHNQDPAEQLNFDPTTRQLSGVGTAYAVITFDKYFLNNKDKITGNALAQADEKSENERKFYWISFPFDVKLSDVFGFGEYGDQWIMEYYDGEARAKEGYWAETETFWKYITNKNYVLKAGQGYVLCLNLNKMGFTSTVFAHTTEVSLYFPSASPLNIITGELPTAVTVPAHECTIERDNRNIYDSNWNLIGVPGFADITDVSIGESHHKEHNTEIKADCVSFYYKYLPATNKYDATNKTENFQTMYAYMVQFAGTINWQAKTMPAQLAARRTGSMPSQHDLRLEIAQGEQTDQTFVQLKEADATAEFDMNVDMTKIFNSGMNIYTLTGSNAIQVAGNALPMGKAIVPVGVRVDAAGEYTFRMPDGTDGIAVTLVDNVTGTHTNMLMNEYTVTLDAGTIENRFYLVVDPDRTATSVENIGKEAKGEEAKGQIKKFLIDGKLFIRTADGIFDAKGQRL